MTWNFTSSALILETPGDFIIFTLDNLYIKFLKFPRFLNFPAFSFQTSRTPFTVTSRKLLTLVKTSHHCPRRPRKGPHCNASDVLLSNKGWKDMGKKMCRIKFWSVKLQWTKNINSTTFHEYFDSFSHFSSCPHTLSPRLLWGSAQQTCRQRLLDPMRCGSNSKV